MASKSDFAVFSFVWKEGKWDYAKKQPQHNFSIPTSDGGVEYLTTQLGATEAG